MCCVCSEGNKTLISEVTSLEDSANGDMIALVCYELPLHINKYNTPLPFNKYVNPKHNNFGICYEL